MFDCWRRSAKRFACWIPKGDNIGSCFLKSKEIIFTWVNSIKNFMKIRIVAQVWVTRNPVTIHKINSLSMTSKINTMFLDLVKCHEWISSEELGSFVPEFWSAPRNWQTQTHFRRGMLLTKQKHNYRRIQENNDQRWFSFHALDFWNVRKAIIISEISLFSNPRLNRSNSKILELTNLYQRTCGWRNVQTIRIWKWVSKCENEIE